MDDTKSEEDAAHKTEGEAQVPVQPTVSDDLTLGRSNFHGLTLDEHHPEVLRTRVCLREMLGQRHVSWGKDGKNHGFPAGCPPDVPGEASFEDNLALLTQSEADLKKSITETTKA